MYFIINLIRGVFMHISSRTLLVMVLGSLQFPKESLLKSQSDETFLRKWQILSVYKRRISAKVWCTLHPWNLRLAQGCKVYQNRISYREKSGWLARIFYNEPRWYIHLQKKPPSWHLEWMVQPKCATHFVKKW